MDSANLFETRTTYRHLRVEFGVALVACSVLLLTHARETNWIHAVVLFTYIDLIGYIPGAIAYHRSPTKQIPRAYYVLYNTMHSFLSASVVAALWVWAFGWGWALLALPIHLCGDRALFGNFMKPFAVRFEPVPHPAYVRLRDELAPPPAENGRRAAVPPAPAPHGVGAP